MNQRILWPMLALAILMLQACVAVQTFPSAARAGDTITLALGSVDGLDKSRLHIYFTPQSTGVPVDLTSNIRSVIKVYPDRTSSSSMSDAWTSTLSAYSGHAIWMNVAIVDLPVSLPAGPGYFRVDFANAVRVASTSYVASAESVQITAEILPGVAERNLFSYYAANPNPITAQTGNFSRLEPLPHVVLRSSSNGNSTTGIRPAAAEYQIRLPVSGDLSTLDDSEVHVIWDYKPGEDNKRIQVSWKRNLDIVTVYVIVPTNLTISEQQYQFSIVVNPLVAGNRVDINGVPELISYRYYDLNGVDMAPTYTPEVLVMQ